jgi:transposase InsO family protein
MSVSKSTYYAWCQSAHKRTKKAEQAQRVAKKVTQLFNENRRVYGSRRLANVLQTQGIQVGRYKVRRLMQELSLVARCPKRFKMTTDSRHDDTISPNTLERQFTVSQPNQVWTTDMTYVWTLQGWLYVAVIIDLFSRQVVGWAMDNHMRTSLCVNALQMAYWRRKPAKGLLHHSDRGSQYASKEYREHLAVMGMEQSMSRKGNCWDNSPTERFFRSLKYEQLHYEKLRTVDEAKLSVIDYLAFYNGKRIHSTLGYKSPLAFERDFLRQSA